MKKQWLIIPLILLATNINAQDAVGGVEEDGTATNEIVTTEEVATNEMGTTEGVATNEMVVDVATTNVSATNMYVETVGYTITNGDTIYASPLARFEVQGLDEQSGLQEILVSVDGGEYATYKQPISFTKEGKHSLSYQFKIGRAHV